MKGPARMMREIVDNETGGGGGEDKRKVRFGMKDAMSLYRDRSLSMACGLLLWRRRVSEGADSRRWPQRVCVSTQKSPARK